MFILILFYPFSVNVDQFIMKKQIPDLFRPIPSLHCSISYYPSPIRIQRNTTHVILPADDY